MIAGKKTKRTILILITVIATGCIILPVLPFNLVEQQTHVDLSSLRLKQTYLILGIPLYTQIETPVLAQYSEHIENHPNWVIALKGGFPNSISPHYVYHGLEDNIETLSYFIERIGLNEEAKKSIANKFHRSVIQDEDYESIAHNFIKNELNKIRQEREESKRHVKCHE